MILWRKFRKTEPVEAVHVPTWGVFDLLADQLDELTLYPTGRIGVRTLEGEVYPAPPLYLCRGAEDEVWPVSEEIFRRTYEPVEGEEE